MFGRNITDLIIDSISDTPVIMLIGPRQVGKTTLVNSLEIPGYKPNYYTFDDLTVLNAAKTSPKAFIDSIIPPVIFDEVQRVTELFLPIKEFVDKRKTKGDFILTGSSNVLLLPKIADSLAGRMEVLKLKPLSQGEIEGTKETFIDWVCSDEFKIRAPVQTESREELFDRIIRGGYPEAVNRKTHARRSAWFNSYITALLQRDVRDLANIEGLSELPRLLSILAARATGIINFAEISRSSGLPQSTLKRYFALLKALFLIEEIPAYSGNLSQRLMKSSKLFFTDSGLLAHLQSLSWSKIRFESSFAGLIFENFVVGELRKQKTWAETPVELLHYRTSGNREVAIVLELTTGEVVGIEIKSASSIGEKSFRGLASLEEALGKKFKRGIVIYAGDKMVAFKENMFAIPVFSLWR